MEEPKHYLDKLARKPNPQQLSELKPVIVQYHDKREVSNVNRALVLAKINAYVGVVMDKRQMESNVIPSIPIIQPRKMDESLVSIPSKLDTTKPAVVSTETPESLVLTPPSPIVAEEKTVAPPTVVEETKAVINVDEKAEEKTVAPPTVVPETKAEEKPVVAPTLVPEAKPVLKGAPKRPRLKIVEKVVAKDVDLSTATINGQPVSERLPKPEKIVMKAPAYYMANRKIYTQKLNELFKEYNKQILDEAAVASCDPKTTSTEVELMVHQKVVRDYLNLFTPYRGLLLYHGLGAGKTATSIAIAEGMKSQKRVFVLTPASLKMNYFSELKKYGDPLFRKNQYWEFISVEGNAQYVDILSQVLSLPREFVINNKGAWLVDVTKSNANFKDLSAKEQQMLDEQLNHMIRTKYVDINYNGLNKSKIDELVQKYGANPFDNSVVIVDEAHNLVSRIINKRNKPSSIPSTLYQMFLSATNARIVLLSGTPIVNTPAEVGVLFNVLRGYIDTWIFNVKPPQGMNTDEILKLFDKEDFRLYDYVDYTNGELTITRNPFGFVYMKKPGMEKGQHRKPKNIAPVPPLAETTTVVPANPPKDVVVQPPLNVGGGNTPCETKFPHTKTRKNIQDSILTTYLRKNTRKIRSHAQPDDVSDSDSDSDSEQEDNKEQEQENQILDDQTDQDQTDQEPETKLDSDNQFYVVEDGIVKMKNPPPESGSEINETVEHEVEREYYKSQNGEGEDSMVRGGADLVFDRYNGIHLNEQGNMSNEDFVKEIKRILRKYNFEVSDVVKSEHYKALPDVRDDFNAKFVDIDSVVMKNVNVFKKRILGLTSYFRSAQESLLPSFIKTPKGEVYHMVECPMSEYQLEVYEPIRKVERVREDNLRKQKRKQKDDEDAISSTYRIYSRLACTFSFPSSIPRPLPFNKSDILEVVDETQKNKGLEISAESIADNIANETDDIIDIGDTQSLPAIINEYNKKQVEALNRLKTEMVPVNNPSTGALMDVKALSREGLAVLSPKYLKMLENLESAEHKGLHLVYSNFRTMEGIGIFKLVLEQNGFAEFKVKKNGSEWEIEVTDPDESKPRFALYTGTETAEERELLRNIYNSNWDLIPPKIAETLKQKHNNNYYGEIIKVLMITASGAEGINLENTRHVHIMEPYWHMTRLDQVVGRARRICSHKHLPEELRTVQVFLYVCVFSETQLKNKKHIELMTSDTGRVSKKAITTDEYLYEGSLLKYNLHNQILKSIKETAMDCNLYSKSNKSENLICYGNQYGKVTSNDFGAYPTIDEDSREKTDINVRETVASISKLTLNGVEYIYKKSTNELFDYSTYQNTNQLVLVGRLEKKGNNWLVIPV